MAKKFKTPEEICVGVIGYGGAFNMGRAHLQLMQQAGMTPAAVCEVDPERLEVALADFPGIATYDSAADMLKHSDINLVTIITPHNTHAALAIQCLRAGRSVVCEKPLAVTTAEVDRMIKVAREQKLVLSTYHNRHWDGCIVEAVKQVKVRKAIGDIVRIEAHMGGYGQPRDWWRSSKRISGGILYDWGVHLLEYSLQLLDGELTEVSAYSHTGFWAPKLKWKKESNEDESFAMGRFSSGQWLSLSVSSIDSKGKDGLLEITGTRGTYVMEGRTYTLIQHKGGKKVITEGRNPKDDYAPYYQNVADHLVKGTPLVITPEWSRRPIHILDLADRSAAQGRALRAKYG